jgi:general secretion pathway protein B
MSFILKALQKVEKEKAALLAKPQDISHALLTPGGPAPRSRRVLSGVTVMTLIALAGGSLAYFLLAHDPKVTPNKLSSTQTEPNKPFPLPAPPPVAAPAVTTSGSSPAKGQDASGNALPAHQLAEESGSKAHLTRPATSHRYDAVPPASAEKNELPHAPPPAGLKVNGIALQDDPAKSIAVINGVLVHRGAVIQGMKVEEILSDRVRFSGNGERCEVKVTK